jgi:colicin import membrane protein
MPLVSDFSSNPVPVPQHRSPWALPLSLLAHGGLIAALFISVAWNSAPPPPSLQAELWEAVPSSASAAADGARAAKPPPASPKAVNKSAHTAADAAKVAATAPPVTAKAAIVPPIDPDSITAQSVKKPVNPRKTKPEPKPEPAPSAAAEPSKADLAATLKATQKAEQAAIKQATAQQAALDAQAAKDAKAAKAQANIAAKAAADKQQQLEQQQALQAKADKAAAKAKAAQEAKQAQAALAAEAAQAEKEAATARDAARANRLRNLGNQANALGAVAASGPSPSPSSGAGGAPVVSTPRPGGNQGTVLGAGYSAKLKACVQPKLNYNDTLGDNPVVVLTVTLNQSSGKPSDPVVTRRSGNAAFDNAVVNAILRCDKFPEPASGDYPPSLSVTYRLND